MSTSGANDRAEDLVASGKLIKNKHMQKKSWLCSGWRCLFFFVFLLLLGSSAATTFFPLRMFDAVTFACRFESLCEALSTDNLIFN